MAEQWFDYRGFRKILRLEREFIPIFAPYTFLMIMEMLVYIITTFYAGRIGEIHLAGVGLGNSAQGIVMLPAMFGFLTVFDTYAPQIYGSNQRKELGTLLIKSLLQGLLVFMVVTGPYLNMVYVIDLLVGEGSSDTDNSTVQRAENESDDASAETVNSIAIKYIRYMGADAFLAYCSDIFNKYLLNQGQMKVVYVVSALFVALQIAFNELFVIQFSMSVSGLCMASYLARIICISLVVMYCYVQNRRNLLEWSGFSMKALNGWGKMMKLGASGSLNLLASIGLIQIATFASRISGITTLSSLLVGWQLIILTNSIWLGIAYTTTIILGNALGDGDKDKIKIAIKLSFFNAVITGIPISVIAYLLRYQIAALFTDVDDVIEMYVGTVWILLPYIPTYYISSTLDQGILISFGKQRFTALAQGIISCCVGAPLVFITVYLTDLNALGIYMSLLTGIVLMLVVCGVRLWHIDIDDEIEATKIRVGAKKNETVNEGATCYENRYVEDENEDGAAENDVNRSGPAKTTAPQEMLTQEQRPMLKIGLAFAAALIFMVILSVISMLKV